MSEKDDDARDDFDFDVEATKIALPSLRVVSGSQQTSVMSDGGRVFQT